MNQLKDNILSHIKKSDQDNMNLKKLDELNVIYKIAAKNLGKNWLAQKEKIKKLDELNVIYKIAAKNLGKNWLAQKEKIKVLHNDKRNMKRKFEEFENESCYKYQNLQNDCVKLAQDLEDIKQKLEEQLDHQKKKYELRDCYEEHKELIRKHNQKLDAGEKLPKELYPRPNENLKLYILKRDLYTCQRCKCLLRNSKEICENNDRKCHDIDHIIPFSVTHDNDQSNLQALCKNCHGEKTLKDRKNYPYAFKKI